MRSMTGFGVGDSTYRDGHVVVEARSVNHRFLDVRVRLPAEVADQSFFMEQLARQRLERGRFDISLQLEGPAARLSFDRERARALYAELRSLRDELAPGTELPVGVLAAFGALVTPSAAHDPETFRAAATRALDEAVRSLDEMRAREGAELERDLSTRLLAISALTEAIADRGPEVTAGLVARLRARIARLLDSTGVVADASRLETEIALLADRGDVSEEVVRLRSHVTQARTLVASGTAVGRRLDFLVQEMGREANTIGAKSQDAESSQLAVELKAEVARMREQVQNVE